jgi:hypothetical protein
MIKFKVLDTSTDLFSHGGYNPRWGTRGKSWDTLNKAVDSVKSYLKYRKYNISGKKLPENIMIVEYQVILNELKRTTINDLIETEVQVCPIVKKVNYLQDQPVGLSEPGQRPGDIRVIDCTLPFRDCK